MPIVVFKIYSSVMFVGNNSISKRSLLLSCWNADSLPSSNATVFFLVTAQRGILLCSNAQVPSLEHIQKWVEPLLILDIQPPTAHLATYTQLIGQVVNI